MGANKRQHQIPRFYLRRFAAAGPNGKIWVYDMEADEVRPSRLENAAVESHLYSYTREDGSRDTRIEEMIAEFEGKAAPVLKKLLAGNALTDQERADFSSFLALMYVRTNSFRQLWAEVKGLNIQTTIYATAVHDEAFESLMRRIEADCGPIKEAEKLEFRQAMIDPSDFELSIERQATLRALKFHDRLAPLLSEMSWILVRAAPGRHFITSDNPLVKSLLTKPPKSFYGGGGFIDREILVSLPLTPSICWLGYWDPEIPATLEASVEMTKYLNRLRAVYAERFLFGPQRDEGVKALAKKYRDTREGIEVSGFGPEKRAPIMVRRRH